MDIYNLNISKEICKKAPLPDMSSDFIKYGTIALEVPMLLLFLGHNLSRFLDYLQTTRWRNAWILNFCPILSPLLAYIRKRQWWQKDHRCVEHLCLWTLMYAIGILVAGLSVIGDTDWIHLRFLLSAAFAGGISSALATALRYDDRGPVKPSRLLLLSQLIYNILFLVAGVFEAVKMWLDYQKGCFSEGLLIGTLVYMIVAYLWMMAMQFMPLWCKRPQSWRVRLFIMIVACSVMIAEGCLLLTDYNQFKVLITGSENKWTYASGITLTTVVTALLHTVYVGYSSDGKHVRSHAQQSYGLITIDEQNYRSRMTLHNPFPTDDGTNHGGGGSLDDETTIATTRAYHCVDGARNAAKCMVDEEHVGPSEHCHLVSDLCCLPHIAALETAKHSRKLP